MKIHPHLVFPAVLVMCTAALAQPSGEMDSHVAAARAAAGLDFRGTFVNLCLPGALPGGARGAAGGGAAGASHTRKNGLVCVALQGIRQSLLVGNAAALFVGAYNQRRHHRDRHQFQLGD